MIPRAFLGMDALNGPNTAWCNHANVRHLPEIEKATIFDDRIFRRSRAHVKGPAQRLSKRSVARDRLMRLNGSP